MRRMTVLCGAGLTLLLPAVAAAQDAAVKKLLRAGDDAWDQREQAGMPEKALEYYKKAMALDEKCAEPYWKAARAQSWFGWKADSDPATAARIYRDGVEYAKLAVAADPDSLHGHYWLGIMYGLFGEARGVMQSLHMIDPMLKEFEWLLARDEKFEAAGAHRFIGWVLFKIPGFKGGDNEKAKKHLQRAIEIAPKCMLNHLYLARVYEAEGKRAEEKQVLLTLLEQPDDPGWSPENKWQRDEARRMLSKLGKD